MKVANVIASPSSRNMVQVSSLKRSAHVAQIKQSGSTNIRMCTQPRQRIHRGSSTPSASTRAVAEQPLLQCSLVPVLGERHKCQQHYEGEYEVVRRGEAALPYDEMVTRSGMMSVASQWAAASRAHCSPLKSSAAL